MAGDGLEEVSRSGEVGGRERAGSGWGIHRGETNCKRMERNKTSVYWWYSFSSACHTPGLYRRVPFPLFHR